MIPSIKYNHKLQDRTFNLLNAQLLGQDDKIPIPRNKDRTKLLQRIK